MKSTLTSLAAAFALTAALLQLGVLPGAWGPAGPDQSAFEARHAGENRAAVAAELDLPAA